MSTFFAVDGITFGMTNEKVFGCRRLVLPMAVRGTDVHVLRTVGTVTLEPSHNTSTALLSSRNLPCIATLLQATDA